MLFFLPCHCRFPSPLSLPRIQNKKNPRSEKAGEGNKPPPPPPLLPQWLRLEKKGRGLEEEAEEPCMKRKREEGAYMDGEGSAFLLLPVPLFPRRYFAYRSCSISLRARSHSSQAKGIAAPKIIILLFTTVPGAYSLTLRRGISRHVLSSLYAGLFCCLYLGIELMQFLLSHPTLTCIFLPVFLSALIFAAKRSW